MEIYAITNSAMLFGLCMVLVYLRRQLQDLERARAQLSPSEHEEIYEKQPKPAPLPVARVVRR